MPKITKHKVTIILDADMFAAIAASGGENDRKPDQEIRYRLRKSFEGSSLASWERAPDATE